MGWYNDQQCITKKKVSQVVGRVDLTWDKVLNSTFLSSGIGASMSTLKCLSVFLSVCLSVEKVWEKFQKLWKMMFCEFFFADTRLQIFKTASQSITSS